MSKARKLAELGNVYDDGALSHRSLIINGAMRVHQRGGTTSITSSSVYTLDRFKAALGGSYTVGADITQDSNAPDGFSKSLKVDITSTSTPATSNNFLVEYRTESQDMLHLDYGSSTAKYLTISFWVKSNKTGTYGFAILHHGKTRNWLSSYTIDAADTWEYKTILIDPDTSTAFDDDANVAFRMGWHLSTGPDDLVAAHTWAASGNYESATGQVNLCDSTSNYWQLTGVQLEVGDTATPFEHRSYGDELARCQRYYWNSYEDVADVGGSGADGALFAVCGPITNDRYFTEIQFPTQMRAQPTLTYYGGRDGIADTAARVAVYNSNTLRSFTTSPVVSRKGFSGYFDTGSNDNAVRFQVIADAEL